MREEQAGGEGDQPTDGRPRVWVKRENLGDGAWLVRCRLCGKKFTRVFKPERSDDPKQALSDWIGGHLASPEHTAAVEAYRAPPKSSRTPEENLLREIFGEARAEETPEQMRRSAAKFAAERTIRRRR